MAMSIVDTWVGEVGEDIASVRFGGSNVFAGLDISSDTTVKITVSTMETATSGSGVSGTGVMGIVYVSSSCIIVIGEDIIG